MDKPNFADEQEAPLDPAFEKVRRKMVRLLVISSSVIVLGLMAVVFSIVYRVNRIPQPSATSTDVSLPPEMVPAARQSIALPAGFALESTSIGGNRILLLGRAQDGSRHMIVHDIGTGRTVTEIEIK